MDSSVIPSFDIFRGRFGDKDVVWIEAAEGTSYGTGADGAFRIASARTLLCLQFV